MLGRHCDHRIDGPNRRPLGRLGWVALAGGGALGVEIQEVRETFDRAITNRRLDVAMGTVEGGRSVR